MPNEEHRFEGWCVSVSVAVFFLAVALVSSCVSAVHGEGFEYSIVESDSCGITMSTGSGDLLFFKNPEFSDDCTYTPNYSNDTTSLANIAPSVPIEFKFSDGGPQHTLSLRPDGTADIDGDRIVTESMLAGIKTDWTRDPIVWAR